LVIYCFVYSGEAAAEILAQRPDMVVQKFSEILW